MSYFCGVDIGGTFTDCVVVGDDGQVFNTKVSSTPPTFHEGFLNALEAATDHLGKPLEEFLGETRLLLHGTTVGTNVLVQMRGAKTGLLTTRGHGDALPIMRSYGRSAGLPIDRLLHVSRHVKPDPIVPRSLIKEVSERIDQAGEVYLQLNEEEARSAIAELLAEEVDAIAISFLWAIANPGHELRVKALVEELAPETFVCCSHELISKPGEYERTAGTAINAFIGPTSSGYIQRVDRATTDAGYEPPLLIMQASGGVVSAAEASEKPLFTIGSGPVGGVTGAAYLASERGDTEVIACDMGGTSFDVGIVAGGEPLTSSETTINQYTFYMPRLDIESIGAGGGSIVWLDENSGTLRVGPESAGASPGPACYGRGGERPTVTDCDVVLGRYGRGARLAGDIELDYDAAVAALAPLAEHLGMDVVEAAAGAVRIVDSQMAGLMRQMTVERGLDPRDFGVYSFGGAGGLHAVAFARELGSSQVVVPLGDFASTWSALGVMTSDVLHVHERSELISEPYDPAELDRIFTELEEEAREQLRADGFAPDRTELRRVVEMKFSLQINQVEVPVPDGRVTPEVAAGQVERFIERYEEIYGEGTGFAGAGTQIGLARVYARGFIATPPLPEAAADTSAGPSSREVYWSETGAFEDTAIHSPTSIGAGSTIDGPAILELPSTTVAVPPGATARIDSYGSIAIDLDGEQKGD
jgi:N-methylhydantoinase A